MEIRFIYLVISFWLGLSLTTFFYWLFLIINMKLANKTAIELGIYLKSTHQIQEFGKTLNEHSSDKDLLMGILGLHCLNDLIDKSNKLSKNLDKLIIRCNNTVNTINIFLKILTVGKIRLAYYNMNTGEVYDQKEI